MLTQSKNLDVAQTNAFIDSIAARVAAIVAAVFLFLLAIDLMGASLTNLAGPTLASYISVTNNPFVGLFIGLLFTAILQSSSTTTSIAVVAVASGSITLQNAIPIILGANIGTTITSTIVSLGFITKTREFSRAVSAATVHDLFNILGVLLIFPLEINYHVLQKASASIAGFIYAGKGDGLEEIGLVRVFGTISEPLVGWLGGIVTLVLAVLLLFATIKLLSNILFKRLVGRSNEQLQNVVFKNRFRSFSWGLMSTAIVQSSSLTTSLIVPIVATSKVKLGRAFQFIMGANIGTTLTAILAGLFRSEGAVSLAIVHLLFNASVVLIFCSVPFLGRLPMYFAQKLGDLTIRFRLAAFIYIALAFFLIPFLLILLSR
jgi:solute carrier family 34 (sodium-dependent phosphate cotransporter)